MGADEKGTLLALKAHRTELIDPLVAAHNGQIVETMGDGLLLSFPSVVEAISCAVAVEAPLAASGAVGGYAQVLSARIE